MIHYLKKVGVADFADAQGPERAHRLWNFTNPLVFCKISQMTHKKWNKEHQTLSFQFFKSSILMCFVLFFRVICKIMNCNMWTKSIWRKLLVLSWLYPDKASNKRWFGFFFQWLQWQQHPTQNLSMSHWMFLPWLFMETKTLDLVWVPPNI